MCRIKMMSKEWSKFLDAIRVKFFQNLADLAVKLCTDLEQDRFVCRFLDQHMTKGIFVL